MFKNIIICSTILLSSCATDTAYDRGHIDYYSRINAVAESNKYEEKAYVPKGRNMGQYFGCLMRYSAYFNKQDSMFICQ